MDDVAIRVDGVSKRFHLHGDRPQSLKERLLTRPSKQAAGKDFWALKDVSLDVPRGSFFGLIGHNGSGKSTLLRLMAGIHTPNGGRIVVVPATDQARGMTADTILADEACFLDDDALTAFFPMRKETGRIILLSTPNMRQGYFYDTWVSGKKVRRITARSIDIPRRRAQVEFDRATMSETTFRREHLCEFIGSGTPLISWDSLESASNNEVDALCLT
jgi:energy-coupling factor transporter ATP-binding protein EcfA2